MNCNRQWTHVQKIFSKDSLQSADTIMVPKLDEKLSWHQTGSTKVLPIWKWKIFWLQKFAMKCIENIVMQHYNCYHCNTITGSIQGGHHILGSWYHSGLSGIVIDISVREKKWRRMLIIELEQCKQKQEMLFESQSEKALRIQGKCLQLFI